MALDRLGNTIVAGAIYALAGTVRHITGDSIVLLLGVDKEKAIRCRAGDIVRVDDTTSGGGGPTAHSTLTGLSADDHPQYVLANGTRAFTAVVVGVDPTGPTHLATKGYTDFADSVVMSTVAAAAAATYQPLNAVLTNLSTFTTSVSGNVAYFVNTIGGLSSFATTSFGRGVVNSADAAAMRAAMGTVIGTDVQAYSAKLAAVAALTWANDKGVVLTGTGTIATFDLTAAARTVLDDTTVAAMVDTLGGAASTGTGGLVRKTSPALTTPDIGKPTAGDLSNCTGYPAAAISGSLPLTLGGTGASTAVAGGDALNVKGADIASAATTNIAAATGHFVHVTGTTTITALGTAAAGVERVVRFAGSLTLTHNATSLILPSGGSIITAANDLARFVSEGSGNWRCTAYQRASSVPFRASDWHPYSAALDDLDQNVIQAGNPGIYGTDGGGTSALVSAAAANDDDLLVVSTSAASYHKYVDLTTLLNALNVPRRTWQENGNPVRTVGAASTAEETLVSQTIGGASNADECWELRFWGDFLQNRTASGSNTSRIRVKLGTTTVFDKANSFAASSGRRVLVGRILVSQRGSTSLQRVTGEILLSQPLNATAGYGDYGAFAAAHGGVVAGDASETLTSAKTLSVTHQWDANDANSYLRIYKAELIYHP